MDDNETFVRPMIYSLIPKVMADIGAVTKDRKNEQQKYAFRGIEDFYLAAHPALIRHGVFCAPEVLERTEYRFDKVNYEGKTTSWIHVTMKVRHRFFAEDGSFVDVITCGEGLDNSDKASNKAMSGAMKYALIELFCVPTKDVEDSDRDSPETGTRRKSSAVTDKPIELGRPGVVPASSKGPTSPASNGGSTLAAGTTAQPEIFIETLKADVKAKQEKKPVDPNFVEFEGCVTIAQRKAFARAWKAEFPPDTPSKDVELLRHDWLKQRGFCDPLSGEATSAIIPAALFNDYLAKARHFARTLNQKLPSDGGAIPF